jgi:hypothetical protein
MLSMASDARDAGQACAGGNSMSDSRPRKGDARPCAGPYATDRLNAVIEETDIEGSFRNHFPLYL